MRRSDDRTQKNEHQYTKILLFSLLEEEEWEEDLGVWRHKAVPVYRKPQDQWTVASGQREHWIYFLPKSISGEPEPASVDFPEWITCNWDSQSGRWIILPSGGGAAPAFFWLDGAVVTDQEIPAIRGSYLAAGSGDPETVINWGAESAGSTGNMLDGAPDGYLGLFVPVMHTEDNPDYQPVPEDPDYDPRETITRQIWAFSQGWCVTPP